MSCITAARLRQAAERREISRAAFLVGPELLKLSGVTGAVFPTLATIARRASAGCEPCSGPYPVCGSLAWGRGSAGSPDCRTAAGSKRPTVTCSSRRPRIMSRSFFTISSCSSIEASEMAKSQGSYSGVAIRCYIRMTGSRGSQRRAIFRKASN